MIERHFNLSLYYIVSDDERMYDTLIKIKQGMKDTNGSISNALRKYYQFVNESMFPKLSDYRK